MVKILGSRLLRDAFNNQIEIKYEVKASNKETKTIKAITPEGIPPSFSGLCQISDEELKEAMREHGIEFFKNVKLAMLEIDGTISIISEDQKNLKQTHYKRKHNHKNLQKL